MTKNAGARALLLVCLLLAGQSLALHHAHESLADCLPTVCAEHESHTQPAGTVSDAGACPVCEMRGEQRVTVAAPTSALAGFAAVATAAHAPPDGVHDAPALAGLRARAPPVRG